VTYNNKDTLNVLNDTFTSLVQMKKKVFMGLPHKSQYTFISFIFLLPQQVMLRMQNIFHVTLCI